MKAKLSEYISFRDVPFALVCAMAWSVVLWIAEYPVGERIGVVVIAYVALWASRLAIVSATLFLSKHLHKLTMETAERLGVEIPEEPSSAVPTITRVLIVVFLSSAMLLSMMGLSLMVTFPVAAVVGLSPLSAGFGIAGLTMFALGAIELSLLFGVPYIMVARTESVVNKKLEAGIRATSSILGARPMRALGFALSPNTVVSR